jgi:hypothetical protein
MVNPARGAKSLLFPKPLLSSKLLLFPKPLLHLVRGCPLAHLGLSVRLSVRCSRQHATLSSIPISPSARFTAGRVASREPPIRTSHINSSPYDPINRAPPQCPHPRHHRARSRSPPSSCPSAPPRPRRAQAHPPAYSHHPHLHPITHVTDALASTSLERRRNLPVATAAATTINPITTATIARNALGASAPATLAPPFGVVRRIACTAHRADHSHGFCAPRPHHHRLHQAPPFGQR